MWYEIEECNIYVITYVVQTLLIIHDMIIRAKSQPYWVTGNGGSFCAEKGEPNELRRAD